jgi:hypothetical protein
MDKFTRPNVNRIATVYRLPNGMVHRGGDLLAVVNTMKERSGGKW